MIIQVGQWVERESRTITHCPSYYAADHETLETIPGSYPLRVNFIGGYLCPMPQFVLAAIASVRKSGALYSGCGGVNYSKMELPAGEQLDYHMQSYMYVLRDLIAAGKVELDPDLASLGIDHGFDAPSAPKTWAELQALADGR